MVISKPNNPYLENSIVVAVQEQVSADLAGEAVILHLKSGVYYGLNSVGERVWNLIQEPNTVKTIRDTLLEEYEVEAEQCDRDLQTLLQELATVGLIEVKHEAAA